LHALIQPVRQAMVANTVPRHDLWNAIALNAIAGNMARVVGPALGGVLYALLSPAANFFLQGGLLLLMALLMVPLSLPYREEGTARRASMLANLTQGFRYVASERVIRHLLLLSYIPALFVASLVQMIPVIAERVLAQGPEVGGVLVGAMGVGGIVGTLGFASMGEGWRIGAA
jgi:predicted MFS family arabinose efflux permease